MALDLQFLLGLDDQEFRSKLRASESEVSRTASKVASVIKSQTDGMVKLSSSLTGIIGAFTGILGVATLIAGAAYGIYRFVDDWAGASERAAEAAKKELERRKEIRETIDAGLLTSRAGAGLVSKDVVSESTARRSFDQLREKLAEETKYNDLLLERWRILAAIYQSEQRRERAKAGQATEFLLIGSGPNLERLAEINDLLSAHEDRLLEIAATEREVLAHIREQAEARADSMEAQARINLLTLAGNTLAADQLKESIRHEEQLRKIEEIALQSEERAQRLRDLENDIHENRMRQIEQEESLRREKDEQDARRAEEQAERDRERTDSIARSNEALAEQQELERLRLTGQEDAAKALELELEHRRNIREIERREGLDDAGRKRLEDREIELFALRRQQLASGAGAASLSAGGGSSRLLSGGFSDSLLARQTFGAGSSDSSPAARNTKSLDKNSQLLERIEVWLRDVARNGAGVGLA